MEKEEKYKNMKQMDKCFACNQMIQRAKEINWYERKIIYCTLEKGYQEVKEAHQYREHPEKGKRLWSEKYNTIEHLWNDYKRGKREDEDSL